MKSIIFNFQGYENRVKNRLHLWQKEKYVSRLQAKDPSLWFSSPTEGITDRLGWLTLPEAMASKLDDLSSFAQEVVDEAYSAIVLCGMGGSSLAPEFFSSFFGSSPGYPALYVLDSTHPYAVKDLEQKISDKKPLFIISSKSGTTLETRSFLSYFWGKMAALEQKPGRHFVAITDPETPLHDLAKELGFRKIFFGPTDVGGRYSALSEFGLLPAALIGVDVEKLLRKATFASQNCTQGDEIEERASCLILGAFLGELYPNRDKMAILTSPSLKSFADWMEQLIAESTGKNGRGIIPLVNEPHTDIDRIGDDRYFVSFFLESEQNRDLEFRLERVERLGFPSVRIYLKEKYDIAQEIYRWEVAVALAGSILGIHPFDQPDVQLAKDYAAKTLKKHAERKKRKEYEFDLDINDPNLAESLNFWLSLGHAGDYIGIQAFLPPSSEIETALQELRFNLMKRTGLPSTLGYGPRFLHSTGQLHKGGPNSGLFLQLVDSPEFDIAIPESNYSFSSILRAQALGDFLALKERKRRVFKIDLGENFVETFNFFRSLLQ